MLCDDYSTPAPPPSPSVLAGPKARWCAGPAAAAEARGCAGEGFWQGATAPANSNPSGSCQLSRDNLQLTLCLHASLMIIRFLALGFHASAQELLYEQKGLAKVLVAARPITHE